MMINTSLSNMDAFKETMNATYAPVTLSQADTGLSNNTDFMKTLENSSSSFSTNDVAELDFSAKSNTSGQVDRYEERKLEERDTKASEDRSAQETFTQKNQQTEKNNSDTNNKTQQEKSTQQAHGGDKQTKNTAEQTTVGETKEVKDKVHADSQNKEAAAKEVLKSQHLKADQLTEVKDGAKENFTGAKSQDATNTADKVTMKNAHPGKEENVEESASENKSDKLDSKFVEELEAKSKDSSTLTQKETKVQKNKSDSNHDSNFYNLINQDKTTQQQTMEVKVEKTSTPQSLLEQYPILKDNVTQNVENSIKVLVNSGESKISVQLSPPELGKVQIELAVKDGKISAHINTENLAVKEVILNNLDQLKVSLQNAGTTIESFDVEVGGFKNQFDQHFGDGSGQGNGNGRNGGGSSSSQDSGDLIPGGIVNQQALSFFLGRSINLVI